MSTYINIFEKHLSKLHSYQAFHFEAELLYIQWYRIEDIQKHFPIFGKDRAKDLREAVVMFEQWWSKLFSIYSCQYQFAFVFQAIRLCISHFHLKFEIKKKILLFLSFYFLYIYVFKYTIYVVSCIPTQNPHIFNFFMKVNYKGDFCFFKSIQTPTKSSIGSILYL